MKKILPILLMTIIVILFNYVISSLILWEPDPGKWPISARSICFLVGSVIGITVGIYVYLQNSK